MANQDIRRLLQSGADHLQKRQLNLAEKEFKSVLEINPRNPDALHLLGVLNSWNGNKKEAVRLIKKAIKIAPKIGAYHRNLALTYVDLGKDKDAILTFKAAIRNDGNDIESYNDLGVIYAKVNRLKDAIIEYKKAIRKAPTYAQAYANLGNALIVTGQLDEAIANYRRAIEIKPNYAEAHGNLGNALSESGQQDQAVLSYHKAITIKPNYSDAYYNLGKIYTALDRREEAIEQYKKAIKFQENFPEAYSNLCEIYEKSNRIDDLREVLKQAESSLTTNDPRILYRMAQLASREKRHDDARDLLEGIQPGKLPLKLRIGRSELLAKTYDKLNQFSLAFPQFKITNDLVSEEFDDTDKIAQRYFDTVTNLSLDWKNTDPLQWDNHNHDSRDYSLVFLVGFPRSGTTLLDTILMSHPDIAIIEEKPMVSAMRSKLAQPATKDVLANLDAAQLHTLKQTYFNELSKHTDLDNHHKIIIDKLPLNLVNAGLIHRVFPDAKFILALRHPLDSILSCYMQTFALNDAMANFLTLEQSAKLYDAVMGLWSNYNSTLKLDVFSPKYESLVTDFNGTLNPLLDFLNLDWDAGIENYRNTAVQRGRINTPSYNQVTQELYTQASGRWINYKDHLKEITPLIQPWIEYFKY